jgi:histidinol-phosphate aminotransferase
MPTPRPGLRDIPPFVLGESTVPGVARVIQLASNENASTPSPKALAAYEAAASQLRRYPDGGAVALRRAIGARHGIDPERIVTGHGSEDLIWLLARCYAGPGDEVVVSQYGYSMLPHAARIAGATIVTAKARGVAPDVDALLAAVTPKTRILYLANPNNPTGACLPESEITRLHHGLPDAVLLMLDAAYAEYVTAADYEPGTRLATTADNVVMLRTFSKAYGLAGLRTGWLAGAADIVDILNRVRPPTNIAAPAQATALAALGDTAHLTAVVAANAATRMRFMQSATQLGLAPHPSEGNFVLVRFPTETGRDAASVYAALRARGILGRRMDPYGLADHLRFTIGTDEEMSLVLEALTDILASS